MLGHVLIIDDSKLDRFIVEKMVERSQLAEKIDNRALATLGLSYLQERIDSNEILPDVIFLDINMPEMSGFDFLEQFNKFPKEAICKCSVVMLSSSLNEEDHKKAMSYSLVKMYCHKPISLAKLQELDSIIALSETIEEDEVDDEEIDNDSYDEHDVNEIYEEEDGDEINNVTPGDDFEEDTDEIDDMAPEDDPEEEIEIDEEREIPE